MSEHLASAPAQAWLALGVSPALLPLVMMGRGPKAPVCLAGTTAGAAAGRVWDLTLLHDSLCTAVKVRLSQNLDSVKRADVSQLCFSLHNRFFPLRTRKIDSLAGRIAEPSHVQMVCTSAFFTALV